MNESIRYEITPRAFRLRALMLVLWGIGPLIPYVLYLRHVGSQLPNAEVMDSSFRLLFVGGVGSAVWLAVFLVALSDHRRENLSITVGDGWIELPEIGKIHNSDIAYILEENHRRRSKVEIGLKGDDPESQSESVFFPHHYREGADLKNRISLFRKQHRIPREIPLFRKQHRIPREIPAQKGVSIAASSGDSRLYYTCGRDGIPHDDGYSYHQILAEFDGDTLVRCDIDEDWTPVREHPDFEGLLTHTIKTKSPPNPRPIKQYDVVRITQVKSDLSDSDDWGSGPFPTVGEEAVVLDVLDEHAFILENVDHSGETLWLGYVTSAEVELTVVWESNAVQPLG
jgi:hypothetical protein